MVTFGESDDEMEMRFTGNQIVRPIQSILVPSDFIKREKDRISGEIPYKEDEVCTNNSFAYFFSHLFFRIDPFQAGRKYIVGNQIITISEPAVKMLLLWSTHPYCDRKPIDEKVVQTLMMSCISNEELQIGMVTQPLQMFIEGSNFIKNCIQH